MKQLLTTDDATPMIIIAHIEPLERLVCAKTSPLMCLRLPDIHKNILREKHDHTGQCKRTGGCYNELVAAFFSTGGGVKG